MIPTLGSHGQLREGTMAPLGKLEEMGGGLRLGGR